jgi:hypothetical protein
MAPSPAAPQPQLQNLDQDKYGDKMSRNFAASARLNLQHSQQIATTGFLLHPSILSTLKPGARIADVATGTGIWVLDASSSASFPPSCEFDGFDISAIQFPSAEYLPENVRFHVWDGTKEVPEEFRGVFDVVHVAYLTIVADDREDAGRWVRNLMELLSMSFLLDTTFSIDPVYHATPCFSFPWKKAALDLLLTHPTLHPQNQAATSNGTKPISQNTSTA